MNIWVSDKKIKSGLVNSINCVREWMFLFRPSMFQESDDIDKISKEDGEEAHIELEAVERIGGAMICFEDVLAVE